MESSLPRFFRICCRTITASSSKIVCENIFDNLNLAASILALIPAVKFFLVDLVRFAFGSTFLREREKKFLRELREFAFSQRFPALIPDLSSTALYPLSVRSVQIQTVGGKGKESVNGEDVVSLLLS